QPARPAPRPAPARAEPPPPPAKAAASARGRDGWLTELLVKASSGDESQSKASRNRASENGLGALDAISGDIARLVDTDAVADAWASYTVGERNVFSRRLYTLQGQQTFDEVRRRYRRDGDFRGTIDRYIEEFERLLKDVAAEDRDGALARSYLMSDTGKVYTMLAHAAGRFD
ncbi:MAG: kinesin, partial [Methylocystis sp.]|nr:kinesin [Methylocystis sp.]